ncbi:MarR family transcriptional regulator [Azospirillum sp. 412522]|nr:MarR family transcriptional regulator [Azospirillum sp. 412522]MBY6262076.1 MarR family transcriptional regulator [Azospirillum sp. 412522]
MMVDAEYLDVATATSAVSALSELYNQGSFRLRRSHQIVLSIYAEECRPLEITATQFVVMFALDRCGAVDQITLARLLGLDRSTTGLVTSLLETRGILRRDKDTADRRRQISKLTDFGRDTLAAVMPFRWRAMERFLEPLSSAERFALSGLLRRFVIHFAPEFASKTESQYSGKLEDLYSRHGFLIRKSHQISASILEEECGALDLTASQFGVLYALNASPGIDQITLGGLLGLDRSNTALVVSLLEEKGLVVRDHDPLDRRRRVLALSDSGQVQLAKAKPLAQRAAERLNAPFLDAESQALSLLLDRLLTHHNAVVRVPLMPSVS